MNVKNLSKRYKTDNGETVVLDNFNIDFEDGKTTAVMGGSGIGKTTLLNCIAKLTDYEGEIIGAGEVAYVFQSDRLLPNKTVYKNVEFVISEQNAEERKRRVVEALKVTELENEAGKFPSELSGGEQQRVSIARALAKNPKIILCDEPTGALDSQTGVLVLKLLLSMAKNYGKTIVIVTHNQNIAKMADEIIRVKNGKIFSIENQDNPLNADEVDW